MAFVAPFFVPSVKADVTETTIIYAYKDVYVNHLSTNYATARNSTTGTINDAVVFIVSNDFEGAPYYNYRVHRTMLYFDTSGIPDLATIDSAILSVQCDNNYTAGGDFNVTIQNGQPIYPHDPIQAGDYYYNWYSGNGGSRSTEEWAGQFNWWNITLNDDGKSWINLAGETKLCLRSQNDIDYVAPSDRSLVNFCAIEGNPNNTPMLYVTYTVATEDLYVYNVYGPYLDVPTGTVYDGSATVTVYPNYNETQTFTLTGDGETADSETFYFEQQPLMMVWNVSSGGNYSRIIYFTDAQAEDIFLFIPDPDEPFYLYRFNVVDMHGISGAYLESKVYFNGSYRVVERQQISPLNPAPFYMQFSVIYRMRVVCDQGTLDTGTFTALDVSESNIVVPYGSFPTSEYGLTVTVNALRMNSTHVQMNYTDADSATIWVHLLIEHKVSNEYVTDYTDNSTDNTVQMNWYSADNVTDYIATVTFLREGETRAYKFALPVPPEADNPWAFIGAPYCYGIAVSIIVASGLVFSYATVVAGSWAVTGLAAFFTAIAWLPQTAETWLVVGFMGLIAALITIAEWKKVEREI